MTVKTKPPIKNNRHSVAKQLRRDIVEHRFKPGELLPTRVDLMKRFNVAPVTMQAAMQQLLSEGFISVSAARYGTRVSLSPPHLCRYEMILPPAPRSKSNYYQALINEANRISSINPDRLISVFDGVQGHADFEKYRKIVDDVRLRRLAGLFFATSLTEYHDTPLLTSPDLPRFAIAAEGQLHGVPKADFNFNEFFKRAVARLAEHGVHCPAVLAESSVAAGWLTNPIMFTLREFGMTTPEPWVQFAYMSSPGAIEQSVRLLFFEQNASQPDGLIIADDNLVEPATRTLREIMGSRADSIPVVAHANFPTVTRSHIRAWRLGVDIRALFNTAMAAIDDQCNSKPTTMFQLIPNVFEEEIGS